jgi:putative ABC transport system permease protein
MKIINDIQFKSSLDAFRLAKLRNFWTMLGVIIGVASFILIVGISEGIKLQINNQINTSEAGVLTIRPQDIQVAGSSLDSLALFSGINVSGSLTNRDISTVTNTPGIKSVAPMAAITAKVVGSGGKYNNGLVIGTSSSLLNILGQSLSYGSFLNSLSNVQNQVIVGNSASMDLFNEDVPLGQTVQINGTNFVVEGILNPFPATPLSSGAEFNKALFINYGNLESLTNNSATTYQILALTKNPKNINKIKQALTNRLLVTHGGQKDFTILSPAQNASSNNTILNLLTKLIIGVSIISLIVGGIGIMNVMLVSITERMHEIGIRKSLGATNRQILDQFLIESTTLSIIGGIIGIILAFLADLLFRMFTNIRPAISFEIVVIALLIASGIGIIFGSVPAYKAAHKDPIEALRSE